jgi:hypothetical protein
LRGIGPCGKRSAGRDGQRSACKRVIPGEDNQIVISRNRNAVLVVVPAHPIDWIMFTGPYIQRDDQTNLFFGRISDLSA